MHDWNNPELQYGYVRDKHIVDGISYQNWIDACYCNIPDEKLTETNVLATMIEMINNNTDYAKSIAKEASKLVLKHVKDLRNES